MNSMQSVQSEIAKTKAAMAALRLALSAKVKPAVKVSPTAEKVLRLGQMFLAGHHADNFRIALGFGRAKSFGRSGSFHPDYRPTAPEHAEASKHWWRWSQWNKRPPINPKAATLKQMIQFFSDHWPEIDWPNDIPRPRKTNKEAA